MSTAYGFGSIPSVLCVALGTLLFPGMSQAQIQSAVPSALAQDRRTATRLPNVPKRLPSSVEQIPPSTRVRVFESEATLASDFNGQTSLRPTAATDLIEAIVFENAFDSGFAFFMNAQPTTGAAFPGAFLADEMILAKTFQPGPTGDRISGYELTVFRSFLDPDVGVDADVTVELWDGDPLGLIDTQGDGFAGALIAGSACTFSGIAVDTLATLRCRLPEPVTVDNPAGRVWMVLTSTACRIGWRISSRVPRIGSILIDPDDSMESQVDTDGETNGQGTCCQNGAACQFDTPNECPGDRTGANQPRGFCSDGHAEDATVASFGGPCAGGSPFDFCASFSASIFAEARNSAALVPVSATGVHVISGDQMVVSPGDRVFLDIRLANWDADLDGSPKLFAWQVNIDATGFTSGAAGFLEPARQPCSTQEECIASLGPGSTCGEFFGPNLCEPGMIDLSRPDYVFFQRLNFAAVDTAHPNFRYASVAPDNPATDSGASVYAGTLVLDVSPDAVGTFTVSPKLPPEAIMIAEDEVTVIGPEGVVPARIVVTPNPLAALPRGRYLGVSAGNAGRLEAVRITFQSLPPPFGVHNGLGMWVGEPRETTERSGSVEPIPGHSNFMSATLQCAPFFTDWNPLGIVQVYHRNIIPGAVYEIEVFDIDNLSRPVTNRIGTTSRWGDVAGSFDATLGTWAPADGRVDIAIDVVSILDGFANSPGAPAKARTDLEPSTPDRKINITDLVVALDAFSGQPYPFAPGPAPCGG